MSWRLILNQALFYVRSRPLALPGVIVVAAIWFLW